MIEFLKQLGFWDEENGTFMNQNRDVSYDDLSESHGSIEVQDMYDDYFNPIIKQIQDKAKELKVKVGFEESYTYGILTVELL